MSSSNSQLSYRPYQSHRRAASSASVNGSQQINTQGAEVQNGSGPSSTPKQLPVPTNTQRTSVPAIRPIAQSASSTPNVANKNTSSPPPLRSISSLRTKPDVASSNTRKLTSIQSTTNNDKGKSNADQIAVQQSPARRIVSSSLTVPSATSSSPSIKPSTDGPSRRNSPAPPPSVSANQSHARSISHGSIPATLPHLMSTAQRLRTASPLDFSSPSSASPTHTPNAPLSPTLNGISGGNGISSQYIPSLSTNYSDGVGRSTAYRAGFQPKGAYRVRTDEFIAARTRRKQNGRGEMEGNGDQHGGDVDNGGKSRSELKSQRLERRLEKLFALHYDDSPLFSEEEAFQLAPAWLPSTIRKARLQTEMERRLREEEMRIVNWEDDKLRKACSICNTPFSLTIRKHHCRLCGRVVCASPHLSLPPGIKGTNKDEGKGVEEEIKCSSLIVADDQTSSKIKDVPRWDEPSSGGRRLDANGRTRGIRICRECKEIILHRQYMLDDGQLPAYVKLYDALISLQKEIEQSLPEFQEMVLGLQKHDAAIALGTTKEQEEIRDPLLEPSTNEISSLAAIKAKNRTALALQRDAAQARKQLLTNFANYDLIAKKIRNLDVKGNQSLERLKVAIYTQANTFLQTNMFPLQNLPKLQNGNKRGGHKSGSSVNGSIDSTTTMTTTNGTPAANTENPIREQIVVLQQQLGLVKRYSASASKARKFQDASSLNASARELELEIERLQKLE